MRIHVIGSLLIGAVVATTVACGGNPPAATPPPDPGSFPGQVAQPAPRPPAPAPPPAAPSVPLDPSITARPFDGMTPQEINQAAPLEPAFFAYDSDTLDDAGREAMNRNAEVLREYTNWVVTIEGHCDERGTAEYNLALGDRRALAAKNFLVSLGIAPDRLRTVSYGKEFPFEPGDTEAAFSRNRRAHLAVVSN